MLEYAKLILAVDSSQAKTAERDLNNLTNAGTKAEKAALGVSSGFNALKGALVAVGAVQLAKSVIETADSYQSLQSRLKLVTSGQVELARVQKNLFDLSQRQLAPVAQITDLYLGLARSGKELGATQNELLLFTEGVGASLRLSGTSAQAASGALLQLTQLLGGATVQAQEFNSLIDGAPELLRAVANNLPGVNGSVAKLTQLVRDGKVPTQLFFEAALKGSQDLIASAEKLKPTVGGALTQIYNELILGVGQSDTSPLVGALNDIRKTVGDPQFQKSLIDTSNNIIQVTAALAKVASLPAQLGKDLGELVAFIQTGGTQLVQLKQESLDLQGIILQRTGFGLDTSEAEARLKVVKAALDDIRQSEARQIVAGLNLPSPKPISNGDATFPFREGLDAQSRSRPTVRVSTGPEKVSQIEKEIASLTKEAALYGDLTELQRVQISLADNFYGKVTPAQASELQRVARLIDLKNDEANASKDAIQAEADRLEAQSRAGNRIEEIQRSLMTGEERLRDDYKQTFDELQRYSDEHYITEVEKANLIAGLQKKLNSDLADLNNKGLEKSANELDEFAKRAAQGIQQSLADFLFDPFKDGLDGLLKNVIRTLQRIAAEIAAAQIARGAFGDLATGGNTGSNGFLGNLLKIGASAAASYYTGGASGATEGFNFGTGGGSVASASGLSGGFAPLPGFALGGTPPIGSPYLVGENGPEIRIDGGPGTILPNSKLGGSTTVNVTMQIDARGATDTGAMLRAVAIAIAQLRKSIAEDFQRGQGAFA